MKQWEYEALQAALTKKSENNPYGRTGNFKREDGYKEGILAAKSILHSFYQRQSQGKEELPNTSAVVTPRLKRPLTLPPTLLVWLSKSSADVSRKRSGVLIRR